MYGGSTAGLEEIQRWNKGIDFSGLWSGHRLRVVASRNWEEMRGTSTKAWSLVAKGKTGVLAKEMGLPVGARVILHTEGAMKGCPVETDATSDTMIHVQVSTSTRVPPEAGVVFRRFRHRKYLQVAVVCGRFDVACLMSIRPL